MDTETQSKFIMALSRSASLGDPTPMEQFRTENDQNLTPAEKTSLETLMDTLRIDRMLEEAFSGRYPATSESVRTAIENVLISGQEPTTEDQRTRPPLNRLPDTELK